MAAESCPRRRQDNSIKGLGEAGIVLVGGSTFVHRSCWCNRFDVYHYYHSNEVGHASSWAGFFLRCQKSLSRSKKRRVPLQSHKLHAWRLIGISANCSRNHMSECGGPAILAVADCRAVLQSNDVRECLSGVKVVGKRSEIQMRNSVNKNNQSSDRWLSFPNYNRSGNQPFWLNDNQYIMYSECLGVVGDTSRTLIEYISMYIHIRIYTHTNSGYICIRNIHMLFIGRFSTGLKIHISNCRAFYGPLRCW